MTITHHPRDELLLSHVTGGLAYPTEVILATHVSLCSRCRGLAALFEVIGGLMLERLEDSPLAANTSSLVLARLHETDGAAKRTIPIVEDFETVRVLPAPLRSLLGKPLGALAWDELTPDVAVARLATAADGKVRAVLTRSRAGSSFAAHDHTGVEFSLPLVGGWSDEYGHFVRGDLSVREPGEWHHAVIDDGEDCLTFSVVDETLVPRGSANQGAR